MTHKELFEQIKLKKSFLCLGLDPDKDKIPKHILVSSEDPLFDFCKAIVDRIHHLCVAIKINTAFFEAYGHTGFISFTKVIEYVNSNYPELFTIADAKRGDIGNTSLRYAKAFFETLSFDAITITPYMGKDSVEPFLTYENKYAILLALTSNEGASDFQFIKSEGMSLYENIIKTSLGYKNSNRLMYVIGATKASYLKKIRSISPDSFFLVPGVGAQGGNLEDVYHNGSNSQVGLLVNSSRRILYAGSGKEYDLAALDAALFLQQKMQKLLK